MARGVFLVVAYLSLLAFPSRSENPNPINATAYDKLQDGGFPIGLLPAGVVAYSLNRTSGDFSVDLGGECRVTLPPDNYLASYSKRVTGNLVAGRISALDGIQVRAFFRWWSITGIRSSGEDIVFEVGPASAKYPSRNFDQSLDCEGHNPRTASS
ncbi:hypothetical protein Cni_G07341 [Canna indica]|uniref:DUF538 family protein n=1 Tax=Canna indica TaxID=4628 RepID=A0AAQ3JYB5_9LILI|nr:hypothetical protein Cni_G07341 [Canna indica]